jgi:hypothetical protein
VVLDAQVTAEESSNSDIRDRQYACLWVLVLLKPIAS